MNSRAVLALLTSAVTVLGVLVVLAVAQPTTVSLEDGVQAKNSPYRGLARDGGTTLLPSPAFSLRDQDGKRRTIGQLRGRPVIVTFLFTACEDTCPAIARQVSNDSTTRPPATAQRERHVSEMRGHPAAALDKHRTVDLLGPGHGTAGTPAQTSARRGPASSRARGR